MLERIEDAVRQYISVSNKMRTRMSELVRDLPGTHEELANSAALWQEGVLSQNLKASFGDYGRGYLKIIARSEIV